MQRRYELSVQNGCVLWGSRVVVPPPGRAPILRLLHEGHPGISRMKALARSVVWWPGLDVELDNKVKSCTACQDTRSAPSKSLLHPWEWPSKPWVDCMLIFVVHFWEKPFWSLWMPIPNGWRLLWSLHLPLSRQCEFSDTHLLLTGYLTFLCPTMVRHLQVQSSSSLSKLMVSDM